MMPCRNPVHPDGCPSAHTSSGTCYCPCHEVLDRCDLCGDEYDGTDGTTICPGCVDEIATVPEAVDIADAGVVL